MICNTTIRDNKKRITQQDLIAIKNGFIEAMVWQDQDLDGGDLGIYDLDYLADELVTLTINKFLTVCYLDNAATQDLIDYGYSQVGHDLCLQLLGHGSGFWDRECGKILNILLDFCIDTGALKPFTLYDDNSGKLKFDYF